MMNSRWINTRNSGKKSVEYKKSKYNIINARLEKNICGKGVLV